VRVYIVWRGFEQPAGGRFGLAHLTGAEVEIGKLVVQLR
jgi:hypothetical protein